tara:strand:- start:715 stop:1272 length:558 start_codon:yes stop_codon:yes gene_type:complete
MKVKRKGNAPRLQRFIEMSTDRHEEMLGMYDWKLKYVGFSLSFCISDILNGYMLKENVIGMNANTKMESLSDLEKVCESYSEAPWSIKEPQVTVDPEKFSKRAWMDTAVWLLLNTKFVQPRNVMPDYDRSDERYEWEGRWHWDKYSDKYDKIVADRHWVAVDPDKFNEYIDQSMPSVLMDIAINK